MKECFNCFKKSKSLNEQTLRELTFEVGDEGLGLTFQGGTDQETDCQYMHLHVFYYWSHVQSI